MCNPCLPFCSSSAVLNEAQLNAVVMRAVSEALQAALPAQLHSSSNPAPSTSSTSLAEHQPPSTSLPSTSTTPAHSHQPSATSLPSSSSTTLVDQPSRTSLPSTSTTPAHSHQPSATSPPPWWVRPRVLSGMWSVAIICIYSTWSWLTTLFLPFTDSENEFEENLETCKYILIFNFCISVL